MKIQSLEKNKNKNKIPWTENLWHAGVMGSSEQNLKARPSEREKNRKEFCFPPLLLIYVWKTNLRVAFGNMRGLEHRNTTTPLAEVLSPFKHSWEGPEVAAVVCLPLPWPFGCRLESLVHSYLLIALSLHSASTSNWSLASSNYSEGPLYWLRGLSVHLGSTLWCCSEV